MKELELKAIKSFITNQLTQEELVEIVKAIRDELFERNDGEGKIIRVDLIVE